LSILVTSLLVMCLGLSCEQFIMKTKVVEGVHEDGALVQTDGYGRRQNPFYSVAFSFSQSATEPVWSNDS